MKDLKINPRVGWRLIDNEIVAFNCRNQQIVIWNETASQLWEALSRDLNFNELVNFLAKEYSLDRENAKRDIVTFLQEASSMDFVEFEHMELEAEKYRDKDDEAGENVLLAIEMKAIEKLIPFAVTFETTYACNENCIHCYMKRGLPSLSLSEITQIVDDLAAEGCLFLTFTGGEFFMRRDAIEIVSYAARRSFVVDILSNGTLVTKEIAGKLAELPVRRVQTSLYGSTAAVHDAITQRKGSLRKTLAGIEVLKSAGVKVEIAFPLMTLNFHERYAVKQLVKDMECILSPSPIITARNDGSKDTLGLRLSDAQLADFIEDRGLASLYAGRKPFRDHQFYFGFKDLLDAAPCYAGFNSCAITPAGKVLPCNQMLFTVGDLCQQSFNQVWHNSPRLAQLREFTLRDLKKCPGCPLLSGCTRCPGLALLEGGDLLGPSPENCRIARLSGTISKKGEVS